MLDIFGVKARKRDKEDLYIAQKLRDSRSDKKKLEVLAYATEQAAIKIIRRYGTEAVDEFYKEIDLIKSREERDLHLSTVII